MNASDSVPEPPTLTLSTLTRTLRTAPELPLVVIWPDGEPIEAHFHVTEVGRVQRDFVDCGGTIRQLATCLLQTWVGEDTDHRITAGKLLKAFAHAESVLRGADLPVELEYDACNVVQLRVVTVEQGPEAFTIRLAKKHTDCLARELCVPSSHGVPRATCC